MSVSTPHDTTIGRNVRTHRERRGLTQAELAGRIGVTFQQVQKYEKGSNRVAASRLCRIALALDVPASTLLGLPVDTTDPVAAMCATPSGRDMADAWILLPQHLQHALLQLATAAAPMIITESGQPLQLNFAGIELPSSMLAG
ncbi:MAG: helix-turn-helix domain-containing protein [Alphaproteobacteria bacterium]|nr:helix-turn-helix domain-containing protein [Alphaproteobacteria bacterium]MBU1519968.1 helix-turn-helix domain-containing protein [Alphaproteobacteria bacterium]MBU2348226.1 helix-turn-helix domain-containing protein [Alphaproteobacteria bacterium]